MSDISLLLAQIALILILARVLGRAARWLHQPQVVGEMVAGLVLGPSVLGYLFPDLLPRLFPVESLARLHGLSQLGLLIFMFLVGLELDHRHLRGLGRSAVAVSSASILLPFALGAWLAAILYPEMAGRGVPLSHFVLFVGTAMSITAFPVLARILTERGMLRTPVGSMAVACAAVSDVVAWLFLAGILLFVRQGDSAGIAFTVAGTLAYLAAMLLVVRPLFQRLERSRGAPGSVSPDRMALVLLLVVVSAWVTEWLGIHALIGAFMAGLVLPRDNGLGDRLSEKLESVTTVLLLPIFFAFTGLQTDLTGLEADQFWGLGTLIIAVAVVGKLGGSALTARLSGTAWRDALTIGTLMNTRGLMELVILGIGLEIGVISSAMFGLMVLMAIVTTLMTTPLLHLLYPLRPLQARSSERSSAIGGVR